MQPALDRTILDRLTVLGRERGHLTTEDLRITLPIERMSSEEIALIVIQLEETGIAVELADGLISPPTPPKKSAEIIPFPKRPVVERPAPQRVALKPAIPQALSADPIQVEEATSLSLWIFALIGLLAFAAFTMIILLIAN